MPLLEPVPVAPPVDVPLPPVPFVPVVPVVLDVPFKLEPL
jgi:hypothetical protein